MIQGRIRGACHRPAPPRAAREEVGAGAAAGLWWESHVGVLPGGCGGKRRLTVVRVLHQRGDVGRVVGRGECRAEDPAYGVGGDGGAEETPPDAAAQGSV